MKYQVWCSAGMSMITLFLGFNQAKAQQTNNSLTCNYTSPLLVGTSFVLGGINVEDHPVEIQVVGSAILTKDKLLKNARIKEVITENNKKTLRLSDINALYDNLVQAINYYYLDQGYLTSKAIAQTEPLISPEKSLVITVQEGQIAKIEINHQGRLTLPYLCDRLAFGISTPLNINQLEENFRLMAQNPLIKNIKGDLKASGKAGYSVLVATVEEADPFQGAVGMDNYSPPSLGGERNWVNLSHGNVTGWGDRMSLSFYRSTTGGSNFLDGSWQFPINAREGTVAFQATPSWTRITQSPFDQFNINGDKAVYEFQYRQPIIRNLKEEFALSVGFRYVDSVNSNIFLERPELFGETRTSVLQFDQEYQRRDQGGIWFLRSRFNWGTGLFKATTNPEPLPDGHFVSWLGQFQRIQRLGRNNLLLVQGELQFTPDPLVSDYLFIIGGGQSVRGYRQNARSGDNGYRLSIEDRITVYRDQDNISRVQIAPFIDLGNVWNASENPTDLPPETFLIGAGLGLILQPWDQFSLRVDYGVPIIDLPDRGNNAQDNGWYFQVQYQF